MRFNVNVSFLLLLPDFIDFRVNSISAISLCTAFKQAGLDFTCSGRGEEKFSNLSQRHFCWQGHKRLPAVKQKESAGSLQFWGAQGCSSSNSQKEFSSEQDILLGCFILTKTTAEDSSIQCVMAFICGRRERNKRNSFDKRAALQTTTRIILLL